MTTATGFIVDRETEEMLEREDRLVMEIRERIRAMEEASEIDVEEIEAIRAKISELGLEYNAEIMVGLLNETIDRKERPWRYAAI